MVILAKVLPGSVLNQVCVFTILLPNCPKPEKSGKNNEKYILEHPYTLKPKRDKWTLRYLAKERKRHDATKKTTILREHPQRGILKKLSRHITFLIRHCLQVKPSRSIGFAITTWLTYSPTWPTHLSYPPDNEYMIKTPWTCIWWTWTCRTWTLWS